MDGQVWHLARRDRAGQRRPAHVPRLLLAMLVVLALELQYRSPRSFLLVCRFINLCRLSCLLTTLDSWEEDYRWPVLRRKVPKWQYKIISLTFIAFIQNILLAATAVRGWEKRVRSIS